MFANATSKAPAPVALLAEGVDRNLRRYQSSDDRRQSPSLRRAWIEIVLLKKPTVKKDVALLAEGVDRNSLTVATVVPP